MSEVFVARVVGRIYILVAHVLLWRSKIELSLILLEFLIDGRLELGERVSLVPSSGIVVVSNVELVVLLPGNFPPLGSEDQAPCYIEHAY